MKIGEQPEAYLLRLIREQQKHYEKAILEKGAPLSLDNAIALGTFVTKHAVLTELINEYDDACDEAKSAEGMTA